MEILVNKNFKVNADRVNFAEEVSNAMKQNDNENIANSAIEVINMYTRRVNKLRHNKNYIIEEGMPFLFAINQN